MTNAKPELELGDLRDQRNALIESGIDPNGLGEPLGIVERLKGRAQFLEDRSEVKSPGLLREAAALISQLTAERDAALENEKAFGDWQKEAARAYNANLRAEAAEKRVKELEAEIKDMHRNHSGSWDR